MTSLLRLARSGIRKGRARPIQFPSNGFDTIPSNSLLEEEKFESFRKGLYYPVTIGEVFDTRYQVLGKLGYGVSSTVWLGYDLEFRRYVALKVYTREEENSDEFRIHEKLKEGRKTHPGYVHVRRALDTFRIPSKEGHYHDCLVLKPMWDSFKDMLRRNSTHRFPLELLKPALVQTFLALDYLHTECHIIHTDIKADNILIEIEDPAMLEAFTSTELTNPSPRKMVGDLPVYQSRSFNQPRVMGMAVLSDYGSAVSGANPRTHDAQPNVYRSPEVMLKIPWSYPIDIWNVGAMVWDLFEDKHLFYGNDPDGKGYSTRAHLAEVIGAIGMPPQDLLSRGKRSREFFSDKGAWTADVAIPQNGSLASLEDVLEEEDKKPFLQFMQGMLQWRPEDRKTAKELLLDPYLSGYTS